MREPDIPQVAEIEARAFPTEPLTPFTKELRSHLALYLVVCCPPPSSASVDRASGGLGQDDLVVGYAGMWLVLEESHLTSIAVREEYRGRAIGELLLISALERAVARGAEMMLLEVRISNTVARSLYEKYGFTRLGVRCAYYTDNNEDALLMTVEGIHRPEYKERLARLKELAMEKASAE